MVFTSQTTEPQQVTTHFTKKIASDVPYYGYRYYNPELGRWINRDPIGEIDAPDIYLFAHNSPLITVDPVGLFCPKGKNGFNINWNFSLAGPDGMPWDKPPPGEY